jgi:hypothetical protein
MIKNVSEKCGAFYGTSKLKRKKIMEKKNESKKTTTKTTKKKKSKKKSGGGLKIVAIILVVLLLIIATVSVFFIIKYREGQKEIKLTIPSDFIEGQAQEDLDKQAKEYGYKVKLNDDGSATYTMTQAQHKKIVSEMKDSLNDSLNEMIGSESYPNFTKIEANDNFTEFTVTTKSTELDFTESFSVLAFYMYGGMYNIFSGEEVDNVSVTFVNADSGQVIETANSSDMGQSDIGETEDTGQQENISQQAEVTYSIGQPWVVDGQWSLTINGITATDQRNEYIDKNPAQVFIIDYSYENLGYQDDVMNGVYLDLSYGQIVDSIGLMGYSYPGDITNYPQEVPIGARCDAQACIGVDNTSAEITLIITQYDGAGESHTATFVIPVN